MSLDSNRLSAAIKADLPTAIKTAMDSVYPHDPNWSDETVAAVEESRTLFAAMITGGIADVIAAKVIEEIVNNAEVAVTSVSGVTAGVDTSGSGTGTIT